MFVCFVFGTHDTHTSHVPAHSHCAFHAPAFPTGVPNPGPPSHVTPSNTRGNTSLLPGMGHQSVLENLREIALEQNPLQNEENYRQRVFDLLPNLVYLDDEDIQGNEKESESEGEEGEEGEGEVSPHLLVVCRGTSGLP